MPFSEDIQFLFTGFIVIAVRFIVNSAFVFQAAVDNF